MNRQRYHAQSGLDPKTKRGRRREFLSAQEQDFYSWIAIPTVILIQDLKTLRAINNRGSLTFFLLSNVCIYNPGSGFP